MIENLDSQKPGLRMEVAKTKQQIADEYGISRKTLSRWLKKNNIELTGYLISPKEQALIYRTFGDPRKKRSSIA